MTETGSAAYRRDADSLQTVRWLLEAAPDAMVVVDRDGRILLVNSQAQGLFGYDRDELLGRPVELLVPERYRSEHAEHRDGFLTDPQRRRMGRGLYLSGRRKDGSEFPVEISLSPVETDDGTTVTTAAVRDISRRVAVEEALTATNRELEAFTYSVSHDLRAPIRQIDGFARLLAERAESVLDEKARHYLDRIREGAEHMGRLVDDLLRLAQVGRQDMRVRLTPLDSVLHDVLTELQGDCAGREISWQVGPLPTVECDPGLMRVVFSNLVSNALKYSRPRSPAVIEIGQTMRNGRPAIYVRDNGVGFDMTYAHRLFGVFQRLHRADEFEGTGVGLATVQRIVHKHGGEIWAEAEPGRGATFTFTVASPGGIPATGP